MPSAQRFLGRRASKGQANIQGFTRNGLKLQSPDPASN